MDLPTDFEGLRFGDGDDPSLPFQSLPPIHLGAFIRRFSPRAVEEVDFLIGFDHVIHFLIHPCQNESPVLYFVHFLPNSKES